MVQNITNIDFQPVASVPSAIAFIRNELVLWDEDSSGEPSVGDILVFSYTIRNTGPVQLTGLTDLMATLGSGPFKDSVRNNGADVLDPGEAQTAWFSHELQFDDLGKTIANFAQVSAWTNPDLGDPEKVIAIVSNDIEVPKHELTVRKQIVVDGVAYDADDAAVLFAAEPPGGKVEYRIVIENDLPETITGLTVADWGLGLNAEGLEIAANSALILDGTTGYELTADWYPGEITNEVKVWSDQVRGSDTATYDQATPKVEITKVTVDGYGNEGEDWAPIAVLEGADVTWKITVTNIGDVDLTDITVVDDMGTPGAADDVMFALSGAEVLKVGDSMTFEHSGSAISAGDALSARYENTATVFGSYQDVAGTVVEFAPSDASGYTALQGAYLTDSAFHDFGTEYQLVFFENHWDGLFSLFGSAPGYVRFNAVLDGDDAVTFRVPFPFVLSGGDAVTAYSGVEVNEGAAKFALAPGDMLSALDYTVVEGAKEDTNADGHVGFGDYYEVTVSGLPTDDLGFVSLLLDYGLKGSQAWEDTGDDLAGDAVNQDDPSGHSDIAEGQGYGFSTLVGGALAETLEITSTNTFDPYEGKDGGDELFGTDADDKLAGSMFADKIHGLDGDDVIRGKRGADGLFGDEGNDRLHGGAGKDYLAGGAGQDRLFGGKGWDHLAGGGGNDLLIGGNGRDHLAGNAGDDRLFGGNGRDLLIGGTGDDRMTGGRGADTFVFRAGDGEDVIRDFDTAHDVIDITAVAGFASWQDVADNLASVTDGVHLSAHSIDVTLKGVEISALGIDNFDLA